MGTKGETARIKTFPSAEAERPSPRCPSPPLSVPTTSECSRSNGIRGKVKISFIKLGIGVPPAIVVAGVIIVLATSPGAEVHLSEGIAALLVSLTAASSWIIRSHKRPAQEGKGSSPALSLDARRKEEVEEALLNGTRRRLYELLQDVGGASLTELHRAVGVSKTAVTWHMNVLEKFGLVKSEILAKKRIYFIPGRRSEATARALLESHTRRVIISELLSNGPKGIRALAYKLNLSTETVKRNVDLMESFNLVSTKKKGLERRTTPTEIAHKIASEEAKSPLVPLLSLLRTR